MLEVSILMDSPVREVLAFKCCNLPDQNLEIHLRNTGQRPIVLPSLFSLSRGAESKTFGNLYPPGEVTVPPGETAAVYCYMDPDEWERYETITFRDTGGTAYRFPIPRGSPRA